MAKQSLLDSKTERPPLVVKEPASYRDVVQYVLPAVVSIEATHKTQVAAVHSPGPNNGPFDNLPDLPEPFHKRFQEFQGQPFAPPAPAHAFGSGFIVDAKGTVLTNDHVVRDASSVQVTLPDGRKFVSHDIKRDPKTDLAIVRIHAKEPLPYLELGDSNRMEIGDRVLAIGAPLGMTGSVTSGIISAKGRDIHMNMYEDFLQTDAAINPGNSGGPLINLEGKVIGINSAIKSETGGFQGIGLAISSNLVKNVMAQLLKDGAVHRGYLGVQVRTLEPEVAAQMGIAHGVVLSQVTAGAPAARAGLQDGDIVIALGGHPVKDGRDLQKIVAGLPAGKTVEFTVLRDGVSKTIAVTLVEQPSNLASTAGANPAPSDEQQGPTSLAQVGIKVIELNPERATKFGYPEKTTGVLITDVDADSMASGAGLRRGMVIVKADDVRVTTVEEARKVFARASFTKGVVLQVRTEHGGIAYVLLKASAAD
jgi:serine protease Do